MLTIVFAETALEFFKGRVLDANDDWKVLSRYENKDKRGRPDIAHDLLKLSLDSGLNKRGELRVFVHTYDERVISVSPELRLPRSYKRFVGLMEDLEHKGNIEADDKTLLKIEQKTLKQLLTELKTDFIVMDATGKKTKLKALVSLLSKNKDAGIILGGFPHGLFLDKSKALAGLPRIAIGETELTAPAVLSAVLTCAEMAREA
ncbi:Ribosomal RNA small subunit methyltransferase Nep1 [Candidatus Norongarragalina meridionalis]|nr:Ribosomal RNA small subunit methyltransferase Nep1 [Candidatus Norongarragalina meridionalis]